ncbi:MAG: zinc transporter ZntB [Alphaproteobacteria bacterium]|nr:zinc transporter ZntB [Alphaproteobacteria bacterium]HPF45597.1 zinc transporter ZntB [Emcibacteraceae bacterium]
MSKTMLLAYDFDGKGGGNAIDDIKVASQKIKNSQLAWVHLDARNPQAREWLENELSYLDPFVVSALLAEETRPRITEIGDGAIIILRGANLNLDADPEDMVSIRMWVDKHRIISVQKRQLKAILDIKERIENGRGPTDAGHFVTMLITRLFERIEPVITELDERTDDIEEKILDDPDLSLRENIIDIRRKAIIFRRYMSPQKDAIGQLRISEMEWLSTTQKRYLYENYDNVLRHVEDLDAIRERAQIVKDELANMLSDRLNKNMYVLSVIAAIFLPLGFLTGLLGINVGGIPGADYAYSFWIFCAILAAIVVGQIIVFKIQKWF